MSNSVSSTPFCVLRRSFETLAHTPGGPLLDLGGIAEAPDAALGPGALAAAELEAKLDRIEHVTTRLPDRVFAFDEFGPLSIRPTAGPGWAPAARPERLPATYRRTHGITSFHGCYSVGTDTLWGINHRHKGAANTLTALKSIRAARPDGTPIYVVLDNLSAHKGKTMRAWARKNKVELCFTPTYASWANPIEAHFEPLRRFTIANSHHPDHTVQTRALHAYLRWRNANARNKPSVGPKAAVPGSPVRTVALSAPDSAQRLLAHHAALR